MIGNCILANIILKDEDGRTRRYNMRDPGAYCSMNKCRTCGWNPEEAGRRKKEDVLHRHKNGLYGF